jgi:hypothetical protein
MPRSGTSWLSQIFDSHPDVRFRLSPLFSYEFKNQLDENSDPKAWEEVLNGAYRSTNEFMDQTRRRNSGEYPVFPEKNSDPSLLVIKDTRFHNLNRRALELLSDLRMVVIVRHPCGAIHSWLTSRGEFPRDANPLLEWRSGKCRKTGYGEFWGFDDWKQVTRNHLALALDYPGRVRIQSYEELTASPTKEVEQLFAFAGLNVSQQTSEFLSGSHNRHIATDYAVFKNPSVAQRWKSELQPQIRDEIYAELQGTDLALFLT